MAKSTFSYDKSIQELESILQRVNNEEITVDELQEKVKRAKELLQMCKKKLRSTEEDINSILDNS